MKNFIIENYNSLLQTLRELCQIPAPSHFEHKRAEYCKNWLSNVGAKDVYIDNALNVICSINCENSNQITVIVAHTDTVFPDKEPMPLHEDDKNIYCPGVGDNTASLAVLLYTAKYFIQNEIKPKHGIMFVCNSCEEGLGNLKGTKQVFKDFDGRIKQFISFDTNLNKIANRCVGSRRYRVAIETEGGHSFLDFGNMNAISALSSLVNDIYNIQVPKTENSHTSYNVGLIEGGTSVNTIAQNASMLCEYRSDDIKCFFEMEKTFNCCFEKIKNSGVNLSVEIIGERPCMSDKNIAAVDTLCETCKNIVASVISQQPQYISSSTDCNIPLSLGIPAACIGVFIGGGMHKREEWVEKSSLKTGLEIALKTTCYLTNN